MKNKIVAIGECMLELARDGAQGWRLAHAGDSFNTAVYLARLGCDTAYVTALGTDPFSAEMRAAWAAEGIDTGLVLADPDRLPGLYAIRTDAEGERSFYYWREQAAVRRFFALPGSDEALDQAADARLLYLSGITLSLFDAAGRDRLVALAAEVRRRGGAVAFDPNYRPRGWPDRDAAIAAIDAFAPLVTLALPTYDDERLLRGDADGQATARRWHEAGAREVVVKLGPEGCLLLHDDGIDRVAPAARIAATDTTGAGDSFNAGYIAARQHGLAPADAAGFANRLAGEVVRHPGAIMPRAAMPALPAAAG